MGSQDEFLKTHLDHLLGKYTVLPKGWGSDFIENDLGMGYEDNSAWEDLVKQIEERE